MLDYTFEIYAYIRSHPGCGLGDLISHLQPIHEELVEEAISYRGGFSTWFWSLPVIKFFDYDDTVNLATIYMTTKRLSIQGLILIDVKDDKRVKFYPTGKGQFKRTFNIRNNQLNLAHA